ncbi:MAG: hypothetical protein BGP04_25085 [Rhizobiales bacterium 62-17]|nr:MAG: hypothetical protein BGP04_25085 [Rhizobiales bacterium 62-17]
MVGAEYYDDQLHPTCADFRAASQVFLKKIFELNAPKGRIADIGCGRSLVREFAGDSLVLIDESASMLNLNIGHNEKRRINVINAPFGNTEFDWIFAVLGDPYNDIKAWRHIAGALKPSGRCVFIVPSYLWAVKFRKSTDEEVVGKARFDLSSGESLFLPSTILPFDQQTAMISSVGMLMECFDHVYVSDLPQIRSKKISEVLKDDDEVLDIYIAQKI